MPVSTAPHSVILATIAGLLLASGATALADHQRHGVRAARAVPALTSPQSRQPSADLLAADDDSDNSKRPELPPFEQDKADETGGPDRALLR
ncbi:hypothetical protein [Methylobacterium isbiliense]|uniref:Uncharacterized protein n=1 Tax=Methylobacterium isbiliense TaxID=315478 RepID=A0ABQ4SC84_9HYPH|nr:hypothetical protein [Methylobacterium isbiliense]MDN3622069.1 hypothetical protein [Methylobacterium isbiliense]GJD99417.1 hypothetical protein GMJLKIPL_1334 [Methylobacterium isbiliense]